MALEVTEKIFESRSLLSILQPCIDRTFLSRFLIQLLTIVAVQPFLAL